jgi:outer membrane protein assembly factor BamB
MHAMNNPASPSVVTDGRNVYAFFTDFGLISYGFDGNERWRLALGPFNNPFGMGASPVLAGDTLIQNCDSETGSFIVAVDTATGKLKWRTERPDSTRGFSTPLIWKSPEGDEQALVPGTGELAAYSVKTGQKVWWVHGLTWQLKPTPVMADGIIYVLGWAGGSDTGQQEELPDFNWLKNKFDANGDGKVSLAEITENNLKNEIDLDTDGFVNETEWGFYRKKRMSQNSLMAVKLGGRGDMTEKNRLWTYTKSLPNATSPLFYQGLIYLMKESGILTVVDPQTGKPLKQARLKTAIDEFYSSPVGADGKVYTVSRNCHITVLKAGAELEVLETSEMEDECFASPAPVDGKIYFRTRSALFAFGKQ